MVKYLATMVFLSIFITLPDVYYLIKIACCVALLFVIFLADRFYNKYVEETNATMVYLSLNLDEARNRIEELEDTLDIIYGECDEEIPDNNQE